MVDEKLRAWWWRRQGLDGSLNGAAPAEVLAKTSWARSVGGVNLYLTLELPAPRGCTYDAPAWIRRGDYRRASS